MFNNLFFYDSLQLALQQLSQAAVTPSLIHRRQTETSKVTSRLVYFLRTQVPQTSSKGELPTAMENGTMHTTPGGTSVIIISTTVQQNPADKRKSFPCTLNGVEAFIYHIHI